MTETWSWTALALLGAWHGVNPAMGWLFAVARGLQARRRTAVLVALPAIAAGHGLSVGLVAAVVAGAFVLVDPARLRLLAGAALVGFALFRFFRPRAHPRWVGMRVGLGELVVWSFLMSTAHGAGFMLVPVLPVLLGRPVAGHHGAPGAPAAGALAGAAAATGVHTLTMLLAMAAVAVLVYEKLGLAILRRAWLNTDTAWALAILVAGVFTLLA